MRAAFHVRYSDLDRRTCRAAAAAAAMSTSYQLCIGHRV